MLLYFIRGEQAVFTMATNTVTEKCSHQLADMTASDCSSKFDIVSSASTSCRWLDDFPCAACGHQLCRAAEKLSGQQF